MFNQVAVVLSHPSHPGNIGACARAMKNMGFSELVLLNPKSFPDSHATALASGADDVLNGTRLATSLTEALEPYHYTIGASARQRSLSWPTVDSRNLAKLVADKLKSSSARVAILFGNETAGLSNEELQACDYHVTIPSNDSFSSLNLSHAVQVLCYEMRMGFMEGALVSEPAEREGQASFGIKQGFYQHLEETLIELRMLNPRQPKLLMSRIKRLFDRSELDETEINILRGILSAIHKRLNGLL